MSTQVNHSEIVLYTTPDGTVKIDTVLQDETIWLTQKKMEELFDVNVPAIPKHLSNIFYEGELYKQATISKMEAVQQEGSRAVSWSMDFYNKRKRAEALAADEEDIKQLEAIENKLLENQGKQNE